MDLGLVNPAVSVALDGLMMRQEAIANNVANLTTANYTATNVDFEGALKSALDMPGSGTASTRSFMSTVASSAERKQDGNNVSLEEQSLLGTETNLRLNLALRAAEGRFNAVRDVLGGR